MPTYEEEQLIALYNLNGTRSGVIFELEALRESLVPEEAELIALTDSALAKLKTMSDADFDALDLIPDFAENSDAG